MVSKNVKNMNLYHISNSGVYIPKMIYGTAWKKENTTDLVIRSIKNGFRGLDTACQPKHYREDLVGKALYEVFKDKIINREELFIQTKFTSLDGQDPNKIPYNKNSKLSDQVKESVNKSLENLQIEYIDSLLLHSPMKTHKDTLTVYSVLEEFVEKGKIKQLGISNIYDIDSLKSIYDSVKIKPSVIQNRFYSDSNFDVEIRKFCIINKIIYQSFWTLTANPTILKSKLFKELSFEKKLSSEQIMYKFMNQINVSVLNGTTNENHMIDDLKVLEIEDFDEKSLNSFKKMIGDL